MGECYTGACSINVSRRDATNRRNQGRVSVESINDPLCGIPVEWFDAIPVITWKGVMVIVETLPISENSKDEVAPSGDIGAIELVADVMSKTVDQEGAMPDCNTCHETSPEETHPGIVEPQLANDRRCREAKEKSHGNEEGVLQSDDGICVQV